MVNKKGLFRIIEAVFAILILSGALITIAVKNKGGESKDLTSELNVLLDEVAKNVSLRDSLLTEGLTPGNTNKLNNFVSSKLSKQDYNYTLKLCAPDEICGLEVYPENAGNIYTAERVLSVSLDQQTLASKKIKIFAWRVGL